MVIDNATIAKPRVFSLRILQPIVLLINYHIVLAALIIYLYYILKFVFS